MNRTQISVGLEPQALSVAGQGSDVRYDRLTSSSSVSPTRSTVANGVSMGLSFSLSVFILLFSFMHKVVSACQSIRELTSMTQAQTS